MMIAPPVNGHRAGPSLGLIWPPPNVRPSKLHDGTAFLGHRRGVGVSFTVAVRGLLHGNVPISLVYTLNFEFIGWLSASSPQPKAFYGPIQPHATPYKATATSHCPSSPPPPLPRFGIENKDALMPDCGVHYLWFAFVCFFN